MASIMRLPEATTGLELRTSRACVKQNGVVQPWEDSSLPRLGLATHFLSLGTQG